MAAAARVRGSGVRSRPAVVRSRGMVAGGLASGQVAGVQRARLLVAAVGAVREFGYPDATVSRITDRARVSRRTFYELFENREECLLAMFDDAVGRIERDVAVAVVDGVSWRERVRAGLGAILAFFDREPGLARVCVVQSAAGSASVLERRASVFARFEREIDRGRGEGARAADAPVLTAEGLVGAVNAILYERLLRPEHGPLTGLLGDLMGMIVMPYLGPAAARREQTTAAPATTRTSAAQKRASTAAGAMDYSDPLAGIPIRLTYRTLRVLECIAVEPGITNRLVGERAEISDQGQTSKLLSRLERVGLASNRGKGHVKGEPNAWYLTDRGERVTRTLGSKTGSDREAA